MSSPSPAPGIIIVSIGDLTVVNGEVGTTTISIEGSGGPGLSAARISLSYDPAVVTVLSAGSSDFDDFTATIESGLVRMIGSQTDANGLTGDVTFAQVQLKAVGKPGEQTTLGLDVNELVDTVGITLVEQSDYTVTAGSFTVASAAEPEPSATKKPLIPAITLFGTLLAVIISFCLLVLVKRQRS
ncbi:MAG: cohesin domain-containing protein [Candidatus Methanospirareceae archaeon]